MLYKIALYPNAAWNEDMETTVLGEPSETVLTVEADYPAKAQEAAEEIILATRTETTQRMQRGKRVVLTTYTTAERCVCAWQTARGLMALVAT